MFFLTVGFIKLLVAPFPRYGYLQLLAILRMREYSHTNVCYRYSNSGTGTGTLAIALRESCDVLGAVCNCVNPAFFVRYAPETRDHVVRVRMRCGALTLALYCRCPRYCHFRLTLNIACSVAECAE